MTLQRTHPEAVEYRILLLEGAADTVLVKTVATGHCLPRVHILAGARPAHQLQRMAREVWGLDILTLDFLPAHESHSRCVVAQLLVPECASLVPIPFSQIVPSELSEAQRTQVERLLTESSKMPFARVGWVDDCISWVEAATEQRVVSRRSIEQYNAGPTYSLLRFHLENGRHCWFKATGPPNTQELPVTCMLTSLCHGFLPQLIASRPAWNAWLMWEEARPSSDSSIGEGNQARLLESAVRALAHLQMRTSAHSDALLRAGAFDQRPATLLKNLDAFFDHLDELMRLQTTTKVPRLPRAQLQEIRQVLCIVLDRIQELNIPDTILHGDLNRGNILFGEQCCQFIDWSEAYVGPPVISLQHLLLLSNQDTPERQAHADRALRERYLQVWSSICDPASFEEAFLYMPLLGIVSTLYGRGSWTEPAARLDPGQQSFARSLTRALDRAAKEPQLVERLCA